MTAARKSMALPTRGQFVSAAVRVLSEDNGPLHYSEITDRALANGWLSSRGLTPRRTMLARFSEWVRVSSGGTPEGQFLALGDGLFRLLPIQPSGTQESLAKRIADHNSAVAKELLDEVRRMHPRNFELLIGKLFSRLGYEDVAVTRPSRDGGFDVEAYHSAPAAPTVKAKIQVKRQKAAIGVGQVRQLRGSCQVNEHPVFVTSGLFSSAALKEAEADAKTIVQTVDGPALADLLIAHQIGARVERVAISSVEPADLVGPIGLA